jgi:hypothetical protein
MIHVPTRAPRHIKALSFTPACCVPVDSPAHSSCTVGIRADGAALSALLMHSVTKDI